MKRLMSVVVCGLMFAGCATKPSTATLAPAGPAKADYFEVNKGGQMYVFGNVGAMQEFLKNGNSGPTVSEYYGSKLVSFQATGEQTRLMTEYEKQHK